MGSYRIEVQTGTLKKAGTDTDITVQLCGSTGLTSGKHILKGKFEKGEKSETFISFPGNLGDLKKILISRGDGGPYPGWYCNYIFIENMDDGKKWLASIYDWFATDESDGQIEREYQLELAWEILIKFKTGDVQYAGTDADVFVQIIGNNGYSHGMQMDDTTRNDFERNRINSFYRIVSSNIGKFKEIRVYHNDKYEKSGWFLDYVKIKNFTTQEHWKADFNRWLDSDEGDKKIDITKPLKAINENEWIL